MTIGEIEKVELPPRGAHGRFAAAVSKIHLLKEGESYVVYEVEENINELRQAISATLSNWKKRKYKGMNFLDRKFATRTVYDGGFKKIGIRIVRIH